MIYTYFPDRPNWRGGIRFVVLFHEGRKWIKLLDTATFETYKQPVSERRRLCPCTIKPKTMASRLTKRRATFKRHGLHFSKRSVQQAINALRQ